MASGLPNTTAISLNVTSMADLDAYVALRNVVVSLSPYTYHFAAVKSAIKRKTNIVATSYVSAELRALDAEAKKMS
jgi:saccharopine dehydrogenase-like NADP-dependent oxidoreductase